MSYILGYAARFAKAYALPANFWLVLVTKSLLLEEIGKPPSSRPRRWLHAFLFAFCLVLAAVAWRYYSTFKWDLFARTLYALDRRWLLAGAAFSLLSYFGRAIRWKVMAHRPRLRIGQLFSATLIGYSAVVIFGRPGEIVRPMLIAKRAGSTFTAQAAVWVLERLYDLLLILVLFGIGLANASSLDLPHGSLLLPIFRLGGVVVTAAAAAAAAILYVLAKHPDSCHSQLLRALSFLPARLLHRAEKVLGSFIRGASSISRPSVMYASLLLTVVEWGIVLVAVWCFFQAHPAFRGFGLMGVAVYLGFVSAGNIIQLPGIGGGVQLASILVLTELFHKPLEAATGLSLLVWAGLGLIVLPFGVPLALMQHLRFSELRRQLPALQGEAAP